jgi:excinuclease UvrABC helicase subunit UvrB
LYPITITISRKLLYLFFLLRKDLSINEELEKNEMSTTASLLSGRRHSYLSFLVLYGIGNPIEFSENLISEAK